jgi:hypothetical protein
MATRVGEYWDLDECRWVRYVATPSQEAAQTPGVAEVPAQAAPAEGDPTVAKSGEGDVRSG